MCQRDSERIDRVLAKIGQFWKRRPDLDLGQVLVELVKQEPLPIRPLHITDLRYVRDEKLLEWLGRFGVGVSDEEVLRDEVGSHQGHCRDRG